MFIVSWASSRRRLHQSLTPLMAADENTTMRYENHSFSKAASSSHGHLYSVNKLVVLFPRTNYMKNSFGYSGREQFSRPACPVI